MTADSWSLNTRRRSEQSDQTRSRIKEDILTEEGSYFVYGQGDYHWVSVSFCVSDGITLARSPISKKVSKMKAT
jgi:hypothetical protein